MRMSSKVLEWQKQFPGPPSNCLKLISFVIIKYIIGRPRISFPCYQLVDIVSIDDAITGHSGTGQERNQVAGLLRRFTELDFIPIHFDFVDSAGSPLFSVERKMSIGDRYRVTVPDQRVDFRVAAAVAVALDALMSR